MPRKKIAITFFIVFTIALIISIALLFYFSKKEPSEEIKIITSETDTLNDTEEAELLQPNDLEYKGAFRLPENYEPIEKSWLWGGSAMTYYPKGDPSGPDDGYPGSIYGTGHEQYQYISEISIPKPVITKNKNVKELNVAETLQEFTDIKGDMFGELEIGRVGIEYIPKQDSQDNDKIYFGWGQHLQEGDKGLSHGWFNTDLSNPQVKGPWKIKGQTKYATTDYIFEIPRSWAEKYTPGMRLVTGRYRDGGQESQGPTAIAYGPWNDGNTPQKDANLSNKVLLKYSNYTEDPEGKRALDDYSHSDAWNGGAWITTPKKQAIIFAGIKGTGKTWYGYRDGTEWPTEPPYPPEGEGERGWWSEKFVGEFIFYNPDDLAKVAQGEMKPYEPQPYATLEIDKYLYNVRTNEIRMMIGAISFDRKNGILYMFEHRGDRENDNTLVHVWKITSDL